MVCPLICIPSPREIPEFTKCLESLSDYDQYIVKYYKAPQAYDEMRRFFLSQPDFDPMVTFADDLIVDKWGLQRLLEDSKKHPNSVISGICNFDMYNHIDKFCFRAIGDHGFYPKINELDAYFDRYKPEYAGPSLIKVEFNAFACCIIPRKIVKKIPFRYKKSGAGRDQNFCTDCLTNKIDLLVDLRVRFQHLAARNQGYLENYYVGTKRPETIYNSSQYTKKDLV